MASACKLAETQSVGYGLKLMLDWTVYFCIEIAHIKVATVLSDLLCNTSVNTSFNIIILC